MVIPSGTARSRYRSGVMALFEYNWIQAGSYPDQAAEHTMARLSIRFGEDEDDVATYLYDRYKKRYVENIMAPLVRLAEWLTVNWFHLWYEMDTVSEEPRPGFASRHDLSYAGNGFVFSRVIFHRTNSSHFSRMRSGAKALSKRCLAWMDISVQRFGSQSFSRASAMAWTPAEASGMTDCSIP